MHKYLLILLVSLAINNTEAQELKARVTVNATRIGNNVNRNVFLTLQTALNNFLNNKKWGPDNFQPNEKIECNFVLTLEATDEVNVYSSQLIIQAARPILIHRTIRLLLIFKMKE